MLMAEITQQSLRDALDYFPETGQFRWRTFSGPRGQVGTIAGSVDKKGYRYIQLNGRKFKAHRLAWFYENGQWPALQIDHINGIKDDNRLLNLRESDYTLNAQNARKARHNNQSCGLLGVSRNKRGRKWRAKITVSGISHFLGYFDSASSAHAAYIDAKRRLHPGCTI